MSRQNFDARIYFDASVLLCFVQFPYPGRTKSRTAKKTGPQETVSLAAPFCCYSPLTGFFFSYSGLDINAADDRPVRFNAIGYSRLLNPILDGGVDFYAVCAGKGNARRRRSHITALVLRADTGRCHDGIPLSL